MNSLNFNESELAKLEAKEIESNLEENELKWN